MAGCPVLATLTRYDADLSSAKRHNRDADLSPHSTTSLRLDAVPPGGITMNKHRFLSPEWQEAAEPIRQQFMATHASPDVPIVANVTLTGVPFGDGGMDLHSLPGIPNVFDPGHVDDPDLTLKMDYALARQILIDRSTNVLELGLQSGQIAIDGDAERLSQHWRSHIGDTSYLEMLTALRGITQ
jgi:hypothetical protein